MSDYRSRLFDEDEADSVIGGDVFFEGEMHFQRPLLVNGRVKGHITSKGDLFINEKAEIDARIHAQKVWVKGRVTGDLSAVETVELYASAVYEGNIRTPDMIMQSGCRFNGRCEMPAPARERVEPS